MAWWRHGVAALSFAVIALNLLAWSVPLILLLPVKMLGARGWRLTRKSMAAIYRLAVRVDDWWLRSVLGIRWPSLSDLESAPVPYRPRTRTVSTARTRRSSRRRPLAEKKTDSDGISTWAEARASAVSDGSCGVGAPRLGNRAYAVPKAPAARPLLALVRERSYVVLANHRSWMDIFLIQSVFARTGLIVKFLAKRELAWIPLLGLIFLAFDFPLLRRSAKRGRDEIERSIDDRRRVREACAVLGDAPGAMLAFAEGTRFTAEKQRCGESPYRHLLRPRLGGVSAICDAVGGPVVDMTLYYPEPGSFWRMLAGDFPAPLVNVELAQVPDAAELRDWLNERWRMKDELIDKWVRELPAM